MVSLDDVQIQVHAIVNEFDLRVDAVSVLEGLRCAIKQIFHRSLPQNTKMIAKQKDKELTRIHGLMMGVGTDRFREHFRKN